jgi:hypothetical protein
MAAGASFVWPDVESAVPIAGRIFLDLLDIDVRNARSCGPVPDVILEARERFGIADRKRLDAAVKEIPDPAAHAFAERVLADEVAETDALHSARDEILARQWHPG